MQVRKYKSTDEASTEGQPLTFTCPRQLSLVQLTGQMEGGKPYMQTTGFLRFQHKMQKREVLHLRDFTAGTHTQPRTTISGLLLWKPTITG